MLSKKQKLLVETTLDGEQLKAESIPFINKQEDKNMLSKNSSDSNKNFKSDIQVLTKKQYLRAGKKLMPINGKLPIYEGWPNKIFSEEDILSHSGNLGWVLGKNDLVIDIDPRNGGEESWKKFKELLNLDLEFSVTTARGGHHIYLLISKEFENYSFRKTLKEFPGIDFLTKGSYCLISGCITEHGNYNWSDDNFLECFEQFEAPNQLIHFISKEKKESDLGDFEGLIGNSSNWPEETVVEMLYKIDPSVEYDTWYKVGMAMHNWDPIRGIELWEEWSKGGENYQEGATAKVSKGFEVGGGITPGTLSYMAKEADFHKKTEIVKSFIDKIKCTDEKTLEFEVFPKLKKSNLGKVDLEKIAQTIQNRYKEISGVKMPISNIRKNISGDVVSGQFIEDRERPEWCKNWVYVSNRTAFVHLETLEVLKSEAFNTLNGKYVPESSGRAKLSATKYIADNGFIETVHTMNYLPYIEDRICNIEGSKVLNSFNKNTVPVEAKKYSKEGLEAIELIKKHIKFICSNDKDSDIFTSWLAHNIQYPGKQILWSPIIQSIQGAGKSFFGELLRQCLGDKNVGTVFPTQVISNFNGWATNVTINVLEELRIKGHNRHDVVNSLKPLITDRVIQINTKGVNQYKAINTTNYICFTNFKDSIPMDADDRRWWVIFVDINSLDEMKEKVGEEAKIYFSKLFDVLKTYKSEVRKWLLEYKLTKFLNIKQAPMTDHKLTMIAMEEAGFQGLSETKYLLKKGGQYFNEDVICSSDFFEELLCEYTELRLTNFDKNKILKELKYIPLGSIFIEGKSRKIWSKKKISNEEVKKLLKLKEIFDSEESIE